MQRVVVQRRISRRIVGVVVLAAGMTLAQTAGAQGRGSTHAVSSAGYTSRDVAGGQVVEFPGDELPGDGLNPWGDLVRRPPRVLRAGLVRPRMNFVPELLKSVENL